MRKLKDITTKELIAINRILKNEYNHVSMLMSAEDVEKKVLATNIPYTGRAVIKVGEYLKSINIKI